MALTPMGGYFGSNDILNIYKLSEEEMMESVVVAMEGDALRWYSGNTNDNPYTVGRSLKSLSSSNFDPPRVAHSMNNGSRPFKRRQ